MVGWRGGMGGLQCGGSSVRDARPDGTAADDRRTDVLSVAHTARHASLTRKSRARRAVPGVSHLAD